jgi:hypothetical protein
VASTFYCWTDGFPNLASCTPILTYAVCVETRRPSANWKLGPMNAVTENDDKALCSSAHPYEQLRKYLYIVISEMFGGSIVRQSDPWDNGVSSFSGARGGTFHHVVF